MPEHAQGHKGRKIGRNAVKCSKYKSEHRRVKNNPLRTPREEERTPHPPHPKTDRAPRPPKVAAVSPGNGRPGQRVAPKTQTEPERI